MIRQCLLFVGFATLVCAPGHAATTSDELPWKRLHPECEAHVERARACEARIDEMNRPKHKKSTDDVISTVTLLENSGATDERISQTCRTWSQNLDELYDELDC